MHQINLTQQLDRLEADGAIPLDSVDFSVRNPELLRRDLGPVFDYFARVEREVERNVLELQILLPKADDVTRRFYGIWEEQEIPHGDIFVRLGEELDLTFSEPEVNHVAKSVRLAGLLAHIPGVHDALLHLYLTIGAMHERLTAVGYDCLKSRLLEMGETAIAQTAIMPIRSQESGHYAYYRNAALLQRENLQPWQLALVRSVRTMTYTPVGALSKSQRADFGDVALRLTGGPEGVEKFAAPVQKVAAELLVQADQGLTLPRFVLKGLQESVELHRERLRSSELA